MIWLLHGNMGMCSDWLPVNKALQGHIPCRLISLWKYLLCCSMSLEEAGAAICRDIQASDPDPWICGYSLGGRLALHAVLHRPELWKGAILISTHTGKQTEEERSERIQRDTEWGVRCLKTPWDVFLREWDAQPVLQGTAHPSRHGLELWKKSISRAFISWSVGRQCDLTAAIKQCTTPQLWLTGEKDEKFCRLGREVAGDNLITIPNTGHRIPHDTPEQLADIIATWIANHENRTFSPERR